MLILALPARADDNSKALSLIEDAADKICGSISTQGSSDSIKAKGDIEAALSGLLKKLGDVGIRGAGEITSQSYVGVLQQDLPKTLEDIRNCKLKVFESLKEKLLSNQSSSQEQVRPHVGWLEPANDPTPENGCGQSIREKYGKGAVLLLLGSSGSVITARDLLKRPTPIIKVGECRLVRIKLSPNGLTVDAEIYDRSSPKPIGTIRDNGYQIDNDQNIVVDRDLHTLVVHEANSRTELLFVKYVNDYTIFMRGYFTCPRPRLMSVRVTNKDIELGNDGSIEANCSVNTGVLSVR
jgi:hypothetical protein